MEKDLASVKRYLKNHAEENLEPIHWEALAKSRIEKHSKAGLVLRGIRYREGISQKELAALSGVSQNDISKIENGKRPVGEKVAKRLAKALKIDDKLFSDV